MVDDELPALEELSWLLRQDERIGEIRTASSGADALRALEEGPVDVVFSDINMPGLDGMDLARVIARFAHRPQIVFVTAYDQHAVDAFAVDAADYVMKPVRPDRLAEAVRRVVGAGSEQAEPTATVAARRRDHPGGACRRHEVHLPQPDPLRPGAGRLRPAAHRHRVAPRADPA